MVVYYKELFNLCGYEDEEIEREKPRIEKALAKWEIGPEDVKEAEERVKKYFEVELKGVRGILKYHMEELIDLPLCREEHDFVVYGFHPGNPRLSLALAKAYGDKMYLGYPDNICELALGSIFGSKFHGILEAAEENGMGPGLGHCGSNQAALGPIVKGIAPVPDLLMVESYQCDQSAKAGEFVHHMYDVPVIYEDAVPVAPWGHFPNYSDDYFEHMVRHWAEGIKLARKEAEEISGVKITDEEAFQARVDYAKVWRAMLRVFDLLKEADPQPISNTAIMPFAFMSLDQTPRFCKEAPVFLDDLYNDIKQRMDEGKGVVEKGAPRCTTWCLSFCDPATTKLYEDCGIALNIFQPYFICDFERVPSKYERYQFEEKLAESFLRKGFSRGTWEFAQRLVACAKESKSEAMFILRTFSCRMGDPATYIMKKVVEDETGLPLETFEFDLFDPRYYPVDTIRTRVETIGEVLRSRKRAAAAAA